MPQGCATVFRETREGYIQVKAVGAGREKVLMVSGVVVALIVIAEIVVVLLFHINSYKPRIETAASEATGLDVRVNGKIGLSFFPFGVSAKDIHVASEGDEILYRKAKRFVQGGKCEIFYNGAVQQP